MSDQLALNWRGLDPTPKRDSVFDGTESERRKQDGMRLAAIRSNDLLSLARNIAKAYARATPERTCHADIVGRILKSEHGVSSLGPCAGSLFRDGCWTFTGDWYTSQRKTNHSRLLRIWRLNDGE